MKWRTVPLGPACLILIAASSVLASGVSLYVAPHGSDRWSGRYAEPTADGKDGPFATLQRALDEVAAIRRAAHAPTEPVTIYLRGGTYYLNEPITITPDHSGTASCPLTIRAFGSEEVVLSGGRKIGRWSQGELNQRTVYIADLPEVKEGKWRFEELWVNGRRAVRARHPNVGYFRVAEVLDQSGQWNEGQRRFRFYTGDLKAWPTVDQAVVVVMNRWTESHLPVIRVDEEQRIAEFARRSVFSLQQDDPYYIENCLGVLDSPGEWFLDVNNGRLYYLPRPGEELDKLEAVAPVLDCLISLAGDVDGGRTVDYVRFKGLTISHTEWRFPGQSQILWPASDVGGFPQAAVGVEAAVRAVGARFCSFEGCRFVHLGTYGLELGRGCVSNQVLKCKFEDLGAGGIKIGNIKVPSREVEQTYGNQVVDCRINDGGKVYHSAVGIWIGQSGTNRIAHCEISDFYYTGISIGWTWGYGQSAAGGNVVECNHVHHIGVKSNGDGPILSDMGGIYTLGVQAGTIIRSNLWHDIAGLRYGGWGIYFDEGSSYIVAEKNIVYNTSHGGFHQHYGRENIVRNNIFAYGRYHQLEATRPEGHIRFQFLRNIVVGKTEKWLHGSIDSQLQFDYNLYWREGGGPIRFGNLTWDEWTAKGFDKHSLVADPQFIDAIHFDFRLKPDSPAFRIGFEPFDLRGVGPRSLEDN